MIINATSVINNMLTKLVTSTSPRIRVKATDLQLKESIDFFSLYTHLKVHAVNSSLLGYNPPSIGDYILLPIEQILAQVLIGRNELIH